MRYFPKLQIFFLYLVSMLAAVGLGVSTTASAPGQQELRIYLFSQDGCPYCAAAKEDLTSLASMNERIRLFVLNIEGKPHEKRWYRSAISHFKHDQAAVPLVIIGNRSFLGYFSGGGSYNLYENAIQQCLSTPCDDIMAKIAFGIAGKKEEVANTRETRQAPNALPLPDNIKVPLIGTIEVKSLSLTALTIVMAAVDGFNPCAMWVLVFLIGLLLGLEDRRRMWILGAAFLAATAVMYFAVMAAWLNIVLFLDDIIWIRIVIGILAISTGLYFLREFWTKPEDACHVTSPGRRVKIMEAFRSIVNANKLILSVFGIMVLAVFVNLIELICSAGIPAVYTQVLTLSDLQPIQYYGYLVLYLAVFLLDDIAIFVTAMVALRVSGLTGKYTRYSHFIGGFLLLAIGATLLLKPELLSFG